MDKFEQKAFAELYGSLLSAQQAVHVLAEMPQSIWTMGRMPGLGRVSREVDERLRRYRGLYDKLPLEVKVP